MDEQIEQIKPGSTEWEDICKQCGLCCLVKYADTDGNVWLTRVRCSALDPETHKCHCYDADINKRGIGNENCAKLGGGCLNYKTLRDDYLVPSCCPYVQKFVF